MATTRIVSIFRVVEIGIVAVQGEVWVGIWYFDIVICMKIVLILCVLDDFGLQKSVNLVDKAQKNKKN